MSSDGASAVAQATMALILDLRARGVSDLRVLRAMEAVPRAAFVPHRYRDLAARNMALPIGCGQKISEPILVARMIQALGVAPNHRVLEIGTGTGYATAILAQLAAEVLSIERFATLATEAKARLEQFGVRNATITVGDGLVLSVQDGLFDRIIVHGILPTIPDAYLAALSTGGILVFAAEEASACRVRRLAHDDDTGFQTTDLFPCRLTRLIPDTARHL